MRIIILMHFVLKRNAKSKLFIYELKKKTKNFAKNEKSKKKSYKLIKTTKKNSRFTNVFILNYFSDYNCFIFRIEI
jgi:hypothetical protein